jgi:hypothetical protein
MSRRRCEDPPDDEDDEPDESDRPLPDPDDEDDEEDEVEYFVEPPELSLVRTSVPNSAHSSHTSTSAPSTFTVFGAPVSVPHISHWTIPLGSPRPRIKRVPSPAGGAEPLGRPRVPPTYRHTRPNPAAGADSPVRRRFFGSGTIRADMSSRVTEPSEPESAEGSDPADLERTVERLDQGVVVTYELVAAGSDPEPVELTQRLPADLDVADVGFRTDAAPAEWSVDGGTVEGVGEAPPTAPVEYVLGLRLPDPPADLPAFPEATITTPDATPEENEDVADVSVEGPRADEPAVLDCSGGLSTSVEQVIGESGEAEDGTRPGPAATDGGRTADGREASGPRPRQGEGSGTEELDAAVAAVEPNLDDGDGASGSDPDESAAGGPELDLSIPGSSDGTADDSSDRGLDAGTPDGAADGDAVDVASLADRLAAADESDRRAVREALGVDEGASEEPDDAAAGTVTVRLERLESRLSAFEAYEDALAAFIEDTGTAEAVEEKASAAADAADELRAEVSELRAEVTSAREERDALRTDLSTLRDDVDEALGLRQQLLGALQEPASGSGVGAGADSEPGDGIGD